MYVFGAYGGSGFSKIFPCFLKRVSDAIAPKLPAVFRMMLKAGSIPLCWQSAANITSVRLGFHPGEKFPFHLQYLCAVEGL